MAKISDLSEELLVKIVSFLPTRVAVSTSILSKQWEFLWMWSPNLEFKCNRGGSVRDFINKNLPLHRASIIKSLRLSFGNGSYQADDSKTWVEIAVSRGLQELSIHRLSDYTEKNTVFLPSSLYTCNSLVTLVLDGKMVLVDVVPRSVFLPSLKKLHLSHVTYSDEDSLPLLLCCCPVLEDLFIGRVPDDNVIELLIKIPSLKRLSLYMDRGCPDDAYMILTPSLKYFKVEDGRANCSYLIVPIPQLELADIFVMDDSYLENLLRSICSVKHLSLSIRFNSGTKTLYGDGILFSNLQKLKLHILSKNWSKIAFQLLKNSPNLEVLDLEMQYYPESYEDYEPVGWSDDEGLVPECLLRSLKSLKFKAYYTKSIEKEEERDFLSYIIKHACCLESTSILGRGQ